MVVAIFSILVTARIRVRVDVRVTVRVSTFLGLAHGQGKITV